MRQFSSGAVKLEEQKDGQRAAKESAKLIREDFEGKTNALDERRRVCGGRQIDSNRKEPKSLTRNPSLQSPTSKLDRI